MSETTSHITDPRLLRWRRLIFTSTWLAYFGYYFCRRPFYLAKSSLEQEFGWTAEDLGLIGSAYLIAYAIGQFVSGSLGNRRGPRVVMLGGMLISIFVNTMFGFTNSLATFALFMTINGFAQSTGWSNGIATMGNWFTRKERGTVMGLWATNFQVGGAVAPLFAAYFLAQYGFRWAFFSGSLVLFLIWAFFIFFQRNKPEDLGMSLPQEEAQPSGELGAQKPHEDAPWTRDVWTSVILIGVFYFFLKLIRYAVWSWVPYMLEKHFKLEKDESGYLSTIFEVTGFLGVLTAGYLSDKLFKSRRALISAIYTGALVLSCFMLYYAGQSNLTIFAICLGAIGFTLFGPDALMTGAGAVDVGGAKRAALAAGIISCLGSAGPVVQELWLGTLLKKGDVNTVFGVLVGSAALAFAAICWVVYRNKTGKSDL
jgi:OPA family sugar phosphate sensor protein UhpC-like MFS transporter